MSQPDLTDESSMADRKPLARYRAIEGALARSLLRLLHHFQGPDPLKPLGLLQKHMES